MDYNKLKMKENIIKTRKAIRKKLMMMRTGEVLQKEKLEKSYKPLIEPMKQLIKTENEIKNVLVKNKIKTEELEKSEKESIDSSDELPSEPLQEIVYHTPAKDDHRQKQQREQDIDKYLEHYDVLPRRYLRELIEDKSDKFDTKTGINYDVKTSKWTIGSSTVNLQDKDFIINGIHYKGTDGLYELLFMKDPKNYTVNDAQKYHDILKRSNALYRNYDPTKQIQGNRSAKYKNIIKTLPRSAESPDTWSGEGYDMIVESKPYRYVYYKNYKKLIDRLEILHASKKAGNNSHDNEINVIEEEFRSADAIE